MEMDVSVQEQIMRHPLSWSNWIPVVISQLAAWKLYSLGPPAAAATTAATTAAGHFQHQSPDLRNWLAQDVS